MLKVFNGEVFERPKWRYVLFVLVLLGLIVLSFVYDNLVGAIFLLFLIGGYAYLQMKVTQQIDLQIGDLVLTLGNRQIPYSNLKGFLFEGEVKSGRILNFVLISPSHYEIFTINDTQENIQIFAQELNKYLPLLETYHQPTIDKLMRKFKI